ncbi:MAG: flavin reductase [Deltaproteobacteria bacterium]|nr:flavin reductase [Deltaproteobacteria bacterium]
MERLWQDVLDRLIYGIHLITINIDGVYNGTIVSWLTQCSYEPTLLALAIRKGRLSHEQLLRSEKVCINLLPRETPSMIKRFKIPDWQNKFEGIEYFHTPMNGRVIENAVAYLDCSLEKTIDPGGDHTLFIVKVLDGKMLKPKSLLLTTEDYDSVYRGNI